MSQKAQITSSVGNPPNEANDKANTVTTTVTTTKKELNTGANTNANANASSDASQKATGVTGTVTATTVNTQSAQGTTTTTTTTATTRTQQGGGNQQNNNKYASSSLYVGDLSKDVTEATLFELFNAVGPVASIRVCRDGATRQSLGYAYVNFHSTKDAERALDTMNFANIKGRQCRIMWSQRDPALRRSNRGNVFVKCLHESIDNKTLYDTFSVFGNILSCKVATNEDGSSRQYGYVHYVDEASAKKAIEGVNGMSINNKVVEACAFQPRSEREKNLTFTNVYVKYIPRHCSESMCKDAFTKLVSDKMKTQANITHSKFWAPEYGVSGCFNFENHEQAKVAVDVLNGFDLRTIYPEPQSENENKNESNDDSKANENDNENENKNENENNELKDDSKENKEENNDNEEKEEKGRIVNAVTGKNNEDTKKAQQKTLFATRALKRRTRDFLLAKEKGFRGGYGRGGGRGGIRPGARYYLGGNLYVKHLLPEVNNEKLKEMFAGFGEIQSARVMETENGESKGFGFVAFKTKDAATRALHEMNMKQQHGNGAKPLYVSRAQSKQSRMQRRLTYQSRYGGRGGGRGGGFSNNNNNIYQGPFSRGSNQQTGYNPNFSRGYTPAGGIYGFQQSGNMQNMQMQNTMTNQLNQPNMQQLNLQTGMPNLTNQIGNAMNNPINNQINNAMTATGNINNQLQQLQNQQIMQGRGVTGVASGFPNVNTQNQRLLQQYAMPSVNTNLVNPQLFRGTGTNTMTAPALNTTLQQMFPFGQMINTQQRNTGINTLTQGVSNSTNIQANTNFNQQTSQTNQMINAATGARTLQNVTALPSTGTANVTNPASSAQMQFPQSVPRTQFSVHSGVGQTQSQQPSQPTNASVPQQGGQSTSVLSAGGRDSAAMKESHPLTHQMLASITTPAEKKRLIGERLFPKIQVVEPRLAGKITGMLLEMDNKVLLTLLNDQNALHGKINEALAVLQEHHKSQQNASNANRASSSNAPQ